MLDANKFKMSKKWRNFLNGRRYFLNTEYGGDGRYKDAAVSLNLKTTIKK